MTTIKITGLHQSENFFAHVLPNSSDDCNKIKSVAVTCWCVKVHTSFISSMSVQTGKPYSGGVKVGLYSGTFEPISFKLCTVTDSTEVHFLKPVLTVLTFTERSQGYGKDKTFVTILLQSSQSLSI